MAKATCKHVDGCDNRVRTQGWCSMHYQRVQNTGDPGPVGSYRRIRHTGKCEIEGCEREYKGHGMCDMHIRRVRKNGEVGPAETLRARNVGNCSVPDCERQSRSRGMCDSHYSQLKAGRPISPYFPDRWIGRAFDRDEFGNKQCRRCLNWVPEKEFASNRRTEDGLAQYCIKCTRFYAARTMYGINEEDYESILASQGGGCGICGSVTPGARRTFAVDHDHACCPGAKSCGKCVRGLLCQKCNIGLGHFMDSPERLRSAAEYLERRACGE